MQPPQPTLAYTPALRYRVSWIFLSYLVIGLVALLPRVLAVHSFATVDEVNFWVRRSQRFLDLLHAGDYASMTVSDHPGVTTVWLGSGGLLIQRALADWGLFDSGSSATRLAILRLPVALVNTAGVLLGYRFLRRLLPAITAALAALLWAADPFVIGFSWLLHVDALMMTFVTLSLLAACVYRRDSSRPAHLIISGICAGLAVLSKSPAIIVLPVIALVVADAILRPANQVEAQAVSRSQLTSAFWRLCLWGAICVATMLVLWPALWANPLGAYAQMRTGVVAEGGQPHGGGNFFLGQPDRAPGLLFYPVSLALRMTPWAMLGLFLLPLAWRRMRELTPARRDLAAWAAFAVLFIVVMSLFPKKFNRYILPVFPIVDILAAVGLLGIGDWRLAIGDWRFVRSKIALGLASIVAVFALLNAAYWQPYDVAYFNQALGGPQAGARAFVIGWGEGLEQVAAWLNQQPDITGVLTASSRPEPLQPYMRPGAQVAVTRDGTLPAQAGYVVVYVHEVQDDMPPAPYDQFYGRATPVHTVSIHGVAYAWIYQVPPAVPQPRPAAFGAALGLRGFELRGTLHAGRSSDLRLFWETHATPALNYSLFLHLIGPDGRHYIQLDLPYPTSEWGANRFTTTHVPLALPADAPAGRYQLVIGLYDPANGQRLPLTPASDPALDGPDALVVTQVEVK